MGTFLKTVLVIACMVMVIPLAVWAMTGSLRHAWFALKRHLFVMGLLVAAGVVVAFIALLGQFFS